MGLIRESLEVDFFVDPRPLSENEKKVLLYKFREISVGDEINVKYKCTECKSPNDAVLSCSDLILIPDNFNPDIKILDLEVNDDTIYDFLNIDLIYGGIILHDLAKIKEMASSELGIVDDYTLEGTLLGHITQGVKEIELAGQEVKADRDSMILLEHMVLSHHYEPEYGSPIKPMIPEAEILHYIDLIDARMYDMRKVTNETEVGKFSERLWSLENRRIYNHGLND